jgi:hypothetical protein
MRRATSADLGLTDERGVGRDQSRLGDGNDSNPSSEVEDEDEMKKKFRLQGHNVASRWAICALDATRNIIAPVRRSNAEMRARKLAGSRNASQVSTDQKARPSPSTSRP